MNSDDKYWITFFGIVAIVIIAVAACTMSYWKHHNEVIYDMIKDGIDPVAAKCALQDDYGNHPVCLVLATKSK